MIWICARAIKYYIYQARIKIKHQICLVYWIKNWEICAACSIRGWRTASSGRGWRWMRWRVGRDWRSAFHTAGGDSDRVWGEVLDTVGDTEHSIRNIVMKDCLMDYSTILLHCKKSVLLSSVLGKFIVKVNTRSSLPSMWKATSSTSPSYSSNTF